MLRYPKTIIFCFILCFISFWILAISYIFIANSSPFIRKDIEHPLYVLLPSEKTDLAIRQGTPPICWGTTGWLYTGNVAFSTVGEARAYMYKHKKAFPPNKTGIYQLSGDYFLDTHPLKQNPQLRCLNKPLTIHQSPQEGREQLDGLLNNSSPKNKDKTRHSIQL